MRVTIVPDDKTVIIDGFAANIPDMRPLPGISAVQWDGAAGEVEKIAGPSEKITSIADWQDIIDAALAQKQEAEQAAAPTKEKAAAKKIEAIKLLKRQKQYAPMDGILIDDAFLHTRDICIGMAPDDPIPTPAPYTGKWLREDGTAREFTCQEFIDLAKAAWERGANIWAVAQAHINNVKALLADDSKTIDDINSYDFSGGWPA